MDFSSLEYLDNESGYSGFVNVIGTVSRYVTPARLQMVNKSDTAFVQSDVSQLEFSSSHKRYSVEDSQL